MVGGAVWVDFSALLMGLLQMCGIFLSIGQSTGNKSHVFLVLLKRFCFKAVVCLRTKILLHFYLSHTEEDRRPHMCYVDTKDCLAPCCSTTQTICLLTLHPPATI